MNISKLVIDPRSVGKHLLLVEVKPYYEYTNGTRSSEVKGYKYQVAMPDNAFDKIFIKIEGNQQMDISASSQEVFFDNLKLKLYCIDGKYDVSATATAIHAVKDKVNA